MRAPALGSGSGFQNAGNDTQRGDDDGTNSIGASRGGSSTGGSQDQCAGSGSIGPDDGGAADVVAAG